MKRVLVIFPNGMFVLCNVINLVATRFFIDKTMGQHLKLSLRYQPATIIKKTRFLNGSINIFHVINV